MDNRGQTNVLMAALGAIVGVIAILIFATVYDAIPKTDISPGAEALLDITDLVLAAVVIIGIVLAMFTVSRM
jgi:hypothetical protein